MMYLKNLSHYLLYSAHAVSIGAQTFETEGLGYSRHSGLMKEGSLLEVVSSPYTVQKKDDNDDNDRLVVYNLKTLMSEMFHKPFDSVADGVYGLFTLPLNLLIHLVSMPYDMIKFLTTVTLGPFLYDEKAEYFNRVLFDASVMLKDVLCVTLGTVLLCAAMIIKTCLSLHGALMGSLKSNVNANEEEEREHPGFNI